MNLQFSEPAPHNFSFNSPQGACPKCKGLGQVNLLDMDKIVPDPSLSIYSGGIVALGKYKNSLIFWQIEALCQKHGVTIKTPIRDIPEEAMDEIMNGTDERLQIKNDSLGSSNYFLSYEGVAKYILMQQESEASASAQKWAGQFIKMATCPECNGWRLNTVISQWANAGHGLDALLNPWNVVLGLAVFFLARILGALYFINNINEDDLVRRCRRALWGNTALFLVFFLAFVIRTLVADGYAVRPETGEVFMEPYKYLTNFLQMPVVLFVFLIGVVAVLWGIIRTLWKPTFDKGIWFAGAGTVLAVLALLLGAGYNNTAYYPSTHDLQSSLTLANSCSSQFTLKVMAYVSILVPFVLAYIFYAWRSIDNRKIDAKEMGEGGHAY